MCASTTTIRPLCKIKAGMLPAHIQIVKDQDSRVVPSEKPSEQLQAVDVSAPQSARGNTECMHMRHQSTRRSCTVWCLG